MLTIHAVAAERGYDGPSRNDARARLIAERLCESPPFFAGTTLPNPDTMFHTPGWLGDLGTLRQPDGQGDRPEGGRGPDRGVAGARGARARAGARGADRRRGRRVARGPFFRYPYVRLNQINWNAELYACAATLTGNGELLIDDYRRHMRRFVAGARRPLERGWARNLSPSYRFQYQTTWADSRKNVDSAEYANITLHFISWYEQALRAGMRPLPPADMRLLRAWAARVQFGYWMHNGMLSWDSGLGFKRWMKAKTWAYALQGPLAIASSPRFWLNPKQGAWAKYVFDRGLWQFAIRCESLAPRHLPSVHLYDVGREYQGTGSRRIYVARMGANAARAIVRGLGEMDAEPPPPFYSFDADIGRLSVSTRRYSTAIVADGGVLPYGGIDLARLYDAQGVPIGGVGGRPPASFGVVLRRPGRSRVLATQASPAGAELSLARSPHGRVTRTRRYPSDPDAGPFAHLEAVGRVARGAGAVAVRHRFTADYIESTWTVTRGRRRLLAEALFPSWGGAAAKIVAVLAGGGTLELPDAGAVNAAAVRYFHLAGPRGGYVLVLEGGGRASARRVARQAAAPRPGPTLAVGLPGTTLRGRPDRARLRRGPAPRRVCRACSARDRSDASRAATRRPRRLRRNG